MCLDGTDPERVLYLVLLFSFTDNRGKSLQKGTYFRINCNPIPTFGSVALDMLILEKVFH